MKVVFVTAPTDAADALAARLVEDRVAACVGVLPGLRSVYRWKGAVERADEVQLVVKTSDAALPRLFERIAALHPYDVPEIVALDAARVHPPYATWVESETANDASA
jgi:periplasmic divalent cation tolerance protein